MDAPFGVGRQGTHLAAVANRVRDEPLFSRAFEGGVRTPSKDEVRGAVADAAVPKNAGRWISVVQHRMARAGEHRSASAVDLVIGATASHHGLTVLHDDADYGTVARHASDLTGHDIHDVV
ncbi:VapC toxin family PIN domain ribonuclease [Streptomyces beigongshangae]|uniref:VapC toxin family PIN domain ribonuclease n=1 Tax=Streptomyces beigongshangae TaxID=2841597 RepID=UPI0021A6E381|nr:VapC toxin family PIN domain ribonuclease [Streptomyces sp. REN17]